MVFYYLILQNKPNDSYMVFSSFLIKKKFFIRISKIGDSLLNVWRKISWNVYLNTIPWRSQMCKSKNGVPKKTKSCSLLSSRKLAEYFIFSRGNFQFWVFFDKRKFTIEKFLFSTKIFLNHFLILISVSFIQLVCLFFKLFKN